MERIKKLLAKLGIAEYRITYAADSTAELFFVKKQLDTRRIKDVEKYFVSVFRTGEKDGAKLKGFTEITLQPSMTDEEMERALADAYFAAQFAMNPWYRAPDPVCAEKKVKQGELAELPAEQAVGVLAESLYAADVHKDAFVNSAEFFVEHSVRHIVSSEGTDVS